MLTFIIRPFIRGTMLISRNALKSVPENRRNICTEDLQEHNSEHHKKFLDSFPEIVSAFSKGESLKIFPDIEEFVTKLLQYNSAGGKKTSGLMTVTAYQMLEKPENLCEGSMRQARTLGWCVELLQTCMLLMDDIIDNSKTRRGALCWYRRPDVGTRAVNDTSLLLALIFDQLKVNFSEKQYYPELIKVFNEAVSQISIGQYLDFVAARNINSFNEKNYTNIAVFKTVYYTFKLPVYVSLLLANKSCVDAYKNEKELLIELGILTLMQNDFLDCFGDEKVVGKAGTDIQEGKCTWLAVQALARGGDAARAQLEACYGRSDAASERRVRTLYERLRLPELYRDAEQAARKKILKQIDAIPADNIVPPALIRKLFHMVYHIPM